MADSVGGTGFPTSGIQKGHLYYDVVDQALWMYISGVPALVSSWRLISGRLSIQPDTSLWGAAQAGAHWFLISNQQFYGWDGSQIVILGGNLYNYKTGIRLQDDFFGGGITTSNIGVLGWEFAGGTVTSIGSEPDHFGVIQRATTATINTNTRMFLNEANALDPSKTSKYTYVMIPIVVDGNTLIRVGITTNLLNSPPTDGIYFEKLDADTNWFCVTRKSNVQTRTDSGISIDVNYVTFVINIVNGAVQFIINNNIVATISTNVPTVYVVPGFLIINSAAASKIIWIDYFEMVAELTR